VVVVDRHPDRRVGVHHLLGGDQLHLDRVGVEPELAGDPVDLGVVGLDEFEGPFARGGRGFLRFALGGSCEFLLEEFAEDRIDVRQAFDVLHREVAVGGAELFVFAPQVLGFAGVISM
jgi:hypothetical protein